jgi:hypothetical protein
MITKIFNSGGDVEAEGYVSWLYLASFSPGASGLTSVAGRASPRWATSSEARDLPSDPASPAFYRQ